MAGKRISPPQLKSELEELKARSVNWKSDLSNHSMAVFQNDEGTPMLVRLIHVNHLPRYREVVYVLMKHGFGFIFDRFTLRRFKYGKTKSNQQVDFRSPSAARHLREAFEELGAAFVKLGQLLSVRPDLLAPAYIEEFEKLQDGVAPFPYEQVEQLCLEEGILIDDLFASFDREPIAAASMGQVHEAYLKTGEHVVVKVQRPNIERR